MSLITSALAAASHSFALPTSVVQCPLLRVKKPWLLPAGHTVHDVARPGSLLWPTGQAMQLLVPASAANCPAAHAAQVAAAALVLPRAPALPAGHASPSHTARTPAAAAKVPLAHATQLRQMHLLLSLHTVAEILWLKYRMPPGEAEQPGGELLKDHTCVSDDTPGSFSSTAAAMHSSSVATATLHVAAAWRAYPSCRPLGHSAHTTEATLLCRPAGQRAQLLPPPFAANRPGVHATHAVLPTLVAPTAPA